ncbi:MAG: phosphotransferase [Ruminococcus sp.]|nr:phosphotransferase [Ruminococcus sp.]
MSMKITHTLTDGRLTVHVSGRVDTTNSADAEMEIMAILNDNKDTLPVFDCSLLEYISSAGLRVLMKIRKRCAEPPLLQNVSSQIYDILETTGFTELFSVQRKKREISVDGCEVIGRGFYGTVYRIDDETVVKVYETADSLSMIENEKRLAKTALIAGVPTAISYDIVKVGDSYGSVFELLNAKTFNDLLTEHPENVYEITKQYAQFLKLVNERQVPAGRLRSAKQMFLGYLDSVSPLLDKALCEKLRALLEEIPEQHNVIHGDSQMKNIMIVDGEPMLIDMDTLCEGYPIFDIQAVYITYFAFGEDYPPNSMEFLGLPPEVTAKVWESFVGYYFDTEDEAEIQRLREKIMIVGCIRFLYLISIMPDTDSELFKLRVKHTARRLEDLVGRVETLLF